MFSKRAEWHAPLNRLTIERRKRGDVLDLTETNPTRAGIDYPLDELSDILGRAARASYDPDPRGLRSAREALAESGHPARLPGAGETPALLDPDDFILTASTSEAYSFLFKLLTDPGDNVLTPSPSYPLFEHLASMELIELRPFALEFHRRWEIHELPANERTRAIVIVNPNNPTGSFVTNTEWSRIAARGLPIISDEVFIDYPLEDRGVVRASGAPWETEGAPEAGTTPAANDVLTFTLGGLSKSAGLPHFKLAWIRVSGPGKREALEALELIADNFLSVATPVQVALPELLRIAPQIREAIRARTRANLATLRAANMPAAQVLPVEGGWSAVIRVPRVMPDEEFALKLLDRGVLVQPGYFFDFPEGHLVVSLLPREDVFREGVTRLADMMPRSS
ncbi:MAG: pyridoxal phosphate-dependent aminotransferase [Acidobacteria bacterium]|nr:MAG: pyridoxal phosphate-dependent aminotransferase [Acidobacteriota bacterium]